MLFSDAAREQVLRRIHDKDRGRARLVLRVRDPREAHQRTLVEQALALPWELLMPEPEVFAVERSELDVVREIVVEGAPEVPDPTGAFSVAVSIAAPEDQVALKYEDEALRLQQALLPLGHGIAFAELGTVDDLAALAEKMEPQALHFSGHGLPGQLVFEDELGCSRRLRIDELVSQLNTRLSQAGTQKRFPRLFFLASCHGVSGTVTADPEAGTRSPMERESRDLGTALGEGPSTAAALHRAGFAQVLGYFGPVSDALCTRAESVFYQALAQGKSTLQATNECRQSLREPLQHGDVKIRYPLAWVQLALYHRGPDRPLALAGAPQLTVPQWRDTLSVSGLPVLQHGFIGRRAIQHEVRRKVRAQKQQQLLLLHGIGGVGKTALATQLLRKVLAQDDQDLLILRCDGLQNEAEPIRKLWAQAEERARELGVTEEALKGIREHTSDPAEGFEKTVECLRRKQRQKQRQLVVYADNMEDLQVAPKDAGAAAPLGTLRPGVTPWWKAMERLSKRGLVMASMRYRFDGPPDEAWVAVDPMRKADTQRLIDTFAGLQKLGDASKDKLVERSQGHPRTVVFVEELLRRQRKRSVGGAAALDAVLERLLATADTQVSDDLMLGALWDCLTGSTQQHALMLSVLRQPVPTTVVEAVGDASVELRDSSLLMQYRLLGKKDGKPEWRERWGMLGVVSGFVRGKLDAQQRQAEHRSLGIALKAHVEGQGEDRLWSDQEEAIHHLHAAHEGDLAWPLVREYVLWLRGRAQYQEALAILEGCEAAHATGERLALALTFLGQMLGQLAVRARDAEAMLDRAVSLAESENTQAFILTEQGQLQASQGKYPEAEALLRRSLALKEKALGTDHPSYGASLHALAGVVSKQGKYPEAEALLRRSLALVEKALGTDHPSYGASLHALAGVVSKQGKYPEAEALLRRSLAIDEKALGTDHPSLYPTLTNLAGIMAQLGELDPALPLVERARSIAERTHGSVHPDVGQILSIQAQIQAAQAHPQALSTAQQAVAILEQCLGSDHPVTEGARRFLGTLTPNR